MDMQRGLPLNRTRAAAWRPQIRPATGFGRHRCLMSVSCRLTRVPQQRLSILTACNEKRGRAPDAGPRERQTRLSIAVLRAGRAAAHAPARSPARRSHAAAERSVDVRTVMEVLGHSQVGVTLNTYAHVLPHKAG
jgi:integrase